MTELIFGYNLLARMTDDIEILVRLERQEMN